MCIRDRSTPIRILFDLQISDSPFMSITFIIGFVGVSTQINFVLSLIKSSTSLRSLKSAKMNFKPNFLPVIKSKLHLLQLMDKKWVNLLETLSH